MIRKQSEMQSETREQMRGGTGAVTIQHYFTSDEFTANARLCAKLRVPPGASIGVHKHGAEDEVYIITHGTGLLNDGETETRVSVGDAILTGNGESHALANDGDEPLELIAMIMCYES